MRRLPWEGYLQHEYASFFEHDRKFYSSILPLPLWTTVIAKLLVGPLDADVAAAIIRNDRRPKADPIRQYGRPDDD